MPKKPIQILLADHHALMRTGVRRVLDDLPEIQVVAEAADGREAVQMVHRLRPQVVVMDVAMPILNGIEATRQIVEIGDSGGNGIGPRRTRVLALSSHRRHSLVQQMLRAGASGYLLKSCGIDELVQAITAVASGHTYLTPEVAHAIVTDYVGGGMVPDASELSGREREVLQMVAEGLPSKLIAAQLHVSIKTVESHRQRLMRKLDLHSVAELTKYALREGLTTLDV